MMHFGNRQIEGQTAMTVRGRVQNGVVVVNGGLQLPEGAEVTVSYPVASTIERETSPKRLQLPLVRSARPGSRMLTADRVAELLEEDNVSP
jgi:hypothetical protein